MKANTPEKIYIEVTSDGTRYYRDVVKEERTENTDIEYTRTDAFIEKACDAYCAICDTKECDGCAECSWVIKFRRQLLKY